MALVLNQKNQAYAEARAIVNENMIKFLRANKCMLIYQKERNKYIIYVTNSFSFIISMITFVVTEIDKLKQNKVSTINFFARQYELNRVVMSISPLGISMNVLNVKDTFDKLYKNLEPFNDVCLRIYHFVNLLNIVNNSLPDEAEYIIESLSLAIDEFLKQYATVAYAIKSKSHANSARFLTGGLINRFKHDIIVLGQDALEGKQEYIEHDMIIMNNSIHAVKDNIVKSIAKLRENQDVISMEVRETEYIFGGKFLRVAIHDTQLLCIYFDNRCGYQYVRKLGKYSPTFVMLLRFAMLNILNNGPRAEHIALVKNIIAARKKFTFYNLNSMTDVICGFAEFTKSRFDKKIISISRDAGVKYEL